MTQRIRSLLAEVLPEDRIRSSDESGATPGTGTVGGSPPVAVLEPGTVEELSQVMALASREGWKVLPAGLGTWLEGGGPSDVDLVVSTCRMNAVQEYEPADLTFTAGAGLSLAKLEETVNPHGQWIPLDPPGARTGSLGALAALGVSGSLRHLYGAPRDHVLGVTMVSGDGRILRWGGKVVKNVAGFDLTRLAVGSWGALGVLTSVSTRLFPLPEADVTRVFQAGSAADLLAAGRKLALSSLPLAAVEFFDPLPEREVQGDRVGRASRGPGLAVRMLGSQAQVAEMDRRIRTSLPKALADGDRFEGEDSRGLQHRLNDWERGADLIARLSLFPSDLATAVEEAEGVAELVEGLDTHGNGRGRRSLEGPRVQSSVHVGAGILRLGVWGLPGESAYREALVTALKSLRVKLEGKGGSLTLTSGDPSLLRQVGPWGRYGSERKLMEGLKRQFDPRGVLAPGRLGL